MIEQLVELISRIEDDVARDDYRSQSQDGEALAAILKIDSEAGELLITALVTARTDLRVTEEALFETLGERDGLEIELDLLKAELEDVLADLGSST